MNPKFLKAAPPQPLRLCESTALARLGHNERKRIHTKQKFGLIGATQWNPTTGSTYVGVSVSAPRIFSNPSAEWDKYLGECRASLNCVAARESVEIQTWSTDLAFEDGLTSITHHVHTLGELTGLITNLLQWALAPTRDYELLDILARALKEGVLVDSHLKRAAEANCLRNGRNGKRLPDPIPTQLLALALAEPGWRGLVSPGDNLWAYMNKTTRRTYQRNYAERPGSANSLEVVIKLPEEELVVEVDSTTTGDELVVEYILDVVKNSGCSMDAIIVEKARMEGKKRAELPKYLTGLTGTHWDRRRVEAARGSLRRKKGKLRASAWSSSRWSPRRNCGSTYRERLPDGSAWNGLWTYSHTLQGDDVEIYREVMFNERKRLRQDVVRPER